ncbi:LptA/OstA family protein [Brevundimonas sp. 2R-24]|uniref:LptA/OstA family protein n=1 Tax=Peiella sedimenti TaxID=3061083 RepID=A0ABT8SH39_9CAUL|nr:LptA/OstA family protein [Caulobacteraceae bacterium XZ-24]
MATRSLALAGALALGLGLTAATAVAQISGSGGPIMMGADNLEVIDAEGVQIWSGRAEATQGNNRMRANVIRAYHAGGGNRSGAPGGGLSGDIVRMVAEGDVYFVSRSEGQPDQVIRGDQAVYTRDTDTIVVTGQVIMTQGENVLTGSRLTVNNTTGRAVMDGAPTEAGRRVRGVFYPENRPQTR